MKKTPWFGASEASPVRDGWYECRNSTALADWPILRYWDGSCWSFMNDREQQSAFGMFPENQWRGLAKKP